MPEESKRKIEDALKKLGNNMEYFARSLEGSLKNVDLEKESMDIMKGTEKALDSLSTTLRRKRENMEQEGVRETLKRDGERVKKEASKGIEDIAEELEKAAERLKNRKK